MHTTALSINEPAHFNFWRTAYSHGWVDLPPFTFDQNERTFSRILKTDDGTVVAIRVRGGKGRILISVASPRHLDDKQRRSIRHQVSSCLRLDEDLSDFYTAARKLPDYRWIADSGTGRMLRAPTVFEDVVKMICTTNCSWALTKMMTANLVSAFGTPFDHRRNAFPDPAAIAASSENFLRRHIKTGYRSPFIIEFAERVASGKLNPESWRTSPLPTDELFKEMSSVKGIGPYAAGNLMKLVGRYDYLALDSWVRAQYYQLHRNGRTVTDSTIERHYAKFGKWRGLFFWFEMTRYWHDEKFRSSNNPLKQQ
jgi:3-methyladenine DNA glycosylase/8-oxoguanine DNA glycosylase